MSIREDLSKVAEQAGFTTQDLATWLEFGFSTVQNWMVGNHNPMPIKQRYMRERLALLRKVLYNKKGGLPVPPTITQYERKSYIEGIRNRALKGLFGPGASE